MITVKRNATPQLFGFIPVEEQPFLLPGTLPEQPGCDVQLHDNLQLIPQRDALKFQHRLAVAYKGGGRIYASIRIRASLCRFDMSLEMRGWPVRQQTYDSEYRPQFPLPTPKQQIFRLCSYPHKAR